MGVVIIPAGPPYIQYMGGIEPGIPIMTATLTYLAHFTDNIHQGQNRSHSEDFFDNIRGSNIHPILTLLTYKKIS